MTFLAGANNHVCPLASALVLLFGFPAGLDAQVSTGAVAGVLPEIVATERGRVLARADLELQRNPVTITSFPSARSAGGLHDFSSEGDYWWPDSSNPGGPYIRRDGMTNPDNFVQHREAMLAFADAVSTLTTASVMTGDRKYARHAAKHLKAWFVDDETRMNPSLLYAQAIHGRVTGRGIGIIDTIHLLDVARSVEVLEGRGWIDCDALEEVKAWFRLYLDWLTTHAYGLEEKEAKNNHGTWWAAQVAEFARLVGDRALMKSCRDGFLHVLVALQMAADGSFPLELDRTKPYSYSLFNLEGMAMICQILSTPDENLWLASLPDGRGMRTAMEFMVPFIADKGSWPHPPDVLYFEYFPARQPCLLFAGIAYDRKDYVALWKSLDPLPRHPEVRRSIPVVQPLLWLTDLPDCQSRPR